MLVQSSKNTTKKILLIRVIIPGENLKYKSQGLVESGPKTNTTPNKESAPVQQRGIIIKA